jgi:tetratricopeptide (TPR) repeat protein
MAAAPLVLIGMIAAVLAGPGQAASPPKSAPPAARPSSPPASGPGFEALAKSAGAARVAGRLDEAIALYRKALALEPRWPEGRFYLGTLLYEKDAFAEARAVLQPLVEFDPKSGPAWAFLGLSEFGLRQYPVALQHIEKGRELGLGGNESLIRVARFHAAILQNRASRFDAATELLVRLAQSQPANPDLVLALGLNLLKRPRLPSELSPQERDLVSKAGQAAYDQATGRHEEARRGFEALRDASGDAPGVAQAYRVFLTTYAAALVDPGEREHAIAQLRARLSEEEQDPEANLYLGLLLQVTDPPEAVACLERAAAARPASLEVAYELARLRLAEGRADEARADLEAVVAREPDFAQAHALLASVYERLGRAPEAQRAREAARRLAGGPAQTKSAPEAAANATRFAALSAKAAAARDANRAAEAIRLYREALALRPSWDEGVFYLGTLLYDLAPAKEAQKEFLRFVNLRPEAGAGWAFLGLCEFRLEDYAGALAHLSRGRTLGLGDNRSLLNNVQYYIAVLLSRREEFEAALQILMAFAAQGNDTPGVIEALGIATLRLPKLPAEVPESLKAVVAEAGRAAFYQGVRRIPEATKAYEDLVRRHPDLPNVHYAFGVFLLAEDPEHALEEFRRELAVSPGHVFAHLHLAFEFIKRSDYDAALPFAEEAARLAPQNFAARNALGRVLVEKGELARGIAELEAGVEIAPDSPEMHFALARAFSQAGRTAEAEKARAEFRRLLEVRKSSRAEVEGVAAAQPPRPETIPP